MATKDIGDGAIAGIITGIIMGILTILLALIGLASLAAFVDVRLVLGGMAPMAGLAVASLTAMITLLLFLDIIGLILGAVFGAIYEDIPSMHTATKGIIFMITVWVIFGLLIPIVLGAGGAVPITLTLTGIVTALVAAVIWGGVLGLLFEWVARRASTPAVTMARTQ